MSGMGGHTSTKVMAGTIQGQYLLLISTRSGRRTWSRGIGVDTRALKEMRRRPAHFEREFMNRIVKRELKHIPRGEKGSLQNFLRFSYNALRRKHLTLRKTRDYTLRELIEKIKKTYPDFIPVYDKDYFKI
jgi:hypothetical protein